MAAIIKLCALQESLCPQDDKLFLSNSESLPAKCRVSCQEGRFDLLTKSSEKAKIAKVPRALQV